MLRANRFQNGDLVVIADDINQLDTFGHAQLVEHLTEIRCGRCVNQRLVPLLPHRRFHSQCGERVDKG